MGSSDVDLPFSVDCVRDQTEEDKRFVDFVDM